MDLKFKPDSSGLVPATHEHLRFASAVSEIRAFLATTFSWVAATSPGLILLCHKFARDLVLRIGAAQQGQRGRAATRATINRRRIVAIEFGTWRSVRSGGGLELMTLG